MEVHSHWILFPVKTLRVRKDWATSPLLLPEGHERILLGRKRLRINAKECNFSGNRPRRRGAWRTMIYSGNPTLCPVQALRHILRARQQMQQTAARWLSVDLQASDVAAALKAIARAIKIPPANYSTHSIRSGGATALMSGGADSLTIKLLGRWMSNCSRNILRWQPRPQ